MRAFVCNCEESMEAIEIHRSVRWKSVGWQVVWAEGRGVLTILIARLVAPE